MNKVDPARIHLVLVVLASLALAGPVHADRGSVSARAARDRHDPIDAPLGALSATRRRSTEGTTNTNRVSRHVGDTESFMRTRSLYAYRAALGPASRGALRRLTRERGGAAHWIDMGSGVGSALRDYVTRRRENHRHARLLDPLRPLGSMRVTGISRGVEAVAEIEGADSHPRFLGGRFLHELSRREIGSADLITDFYGPASYADSLDEVIYQYGLLAREGATIALVLDRTAIANSSVGGFAPEALTDPAHRVVAAARLPAAFRSWIEDGSGLEVVECAPVRRIAGTTIVGENAAVRVVLRRTTAPLRVRALDLRQYRDATPPGRVYERTERGWVGDASTVR